MTIAEQARTQGFKANLLIRGRAVTSDSLDSRGVPETFTALVEDQPMLADPDKPAQAQTPVYTRISALTGVIADPRKPQRFTENQGGRFHKVLRYEETSGDRVKWSWFCEAQRA